MTEPITVPLNKLTRSRDNVRGAKDAAAAAAHVELVASIRAHGLIQSLAVVENGGGKYGVVAGGRRLAALKELAQAGDLPKDWPVPCIVQAADGASEASLAENTVRVAMHPADQVEAFAKLAKAGASPEQIGTRFGIAKRTVERRLRLGGLPKPILAAWRNGEVAEDAVLALASTADPKQSKAVFDALREHGGRITPWDVNRMLGGEGGLPGDRAICRFVGPEAYTEAGGKLHEDLFADGPESLTYQDADLVTDLAQKKLDALAAAAAADGWKWTEAKLRLDWQTGDHYRTHKVTGTLPEPTDAEKAEIDAIHARMTELSEGVEAGEIGEESPTETEGYETVEEEWNALDARMNALDADREARATYTDEDKARSGVCFTLDGDGTVLAYRGALAPEDVKAERKAEQKAAQRAQQAEQAAQAANGAGKAEAQPTGPKPLSDALRTDLREIRGACIRNALQENPRLAMDVLAFTLARKGRFGHSGYESGNVLNVTMPHRAEGVTPKFRESDLAATVLNPTPPVAVTKGAGWNEGPIPEALDKFLALPEHTRNAVLAAAVADTLIPALADDVDDHRHGIERPADALAVIVKRLGVDWPERLQEVGAAPWSVEVLWGRLSKAQILAVAEKELGKEWVEQHRTLKKGLLADAAANAFAQRPGFLPEGF